MRLCGSPAGDQHPSAHRRMELPHGQLPAPGPCRPSVCRIPPRFASLIRAGNLYLSAHDVVALAIENNIDVEIQRYGPLLAQQILLRAQAGGALRSVGLGVASGPQSVSLQGVSVNTSGGVGLSAGNGVGSGGGIVTQLGPQYSFARSVRSWASPVSDTPPLRRATWSSPMTADPGEFDTLLSKRSMRRTSISA